MEQSPASRVAIVCINAEANRRDQHFGEWPPTLVSRCLLIAAGVATTVFSTE